MTVEWAVVDTRGGPTGQVVVLETGDGNQVCTGDDGNDKASVDGLDCTST